MKPILFIDRDGTLIEEPPDEQVDSLEKLIFIPGAIAALGTIARSDRYALVLVTNQDGLGTNRFPEASFWPAHRAMIEAYAAGGVTFVATHIDRSLPEEKKPTRKPGTGMLTEYLGGGYDLQNSFVIGDRFTDLQLAKNLGIKGILFGTRERQEKLSTEDLAETCVLATRSWEEIQKFVLRNHA